MKIVQLLSGIDLALSNQEKAFVAKHKDHVRIQSLSEHDQWVAQNLVRKGVYELSKDSKILINRLDENRRK